MSISTFSVVRKLIEALSPLDSSMQEFVSNCVANI